MRRAFDGDQALSKLREPKEAERLRPDLIMLNLSLPKRSGFELLEEMKKGALVHSFTMGEFLF
jgi:DNA-binding response OmpR family regulator